MVTGKGCRGLRFRKKRAQGLRDREVSGDPELDAEVPDLQHLLRVPRCMQGFCVFSLSSTSPKPYLPYLINPNPEASALNPTP